MTVYFQGHKPIPMRPAPMFGERVKIIEPLSGLLEPSPTPEEIRNPDGGKIARWSKRMSRLFAAGWGMLVSLVANFWSFTGGDYLFLRKKMKKFQVEDPS